MIFFSAWRGTLMSGILAMVCLAISCTVARPIRLRRCRMAWARYTLCERAPACITFTSTNWWDSNSENKLTQLGISSCQRHELITLYNSSILCSQALIPNGVHLYSLTGREGCPHLPSARAAAAAAVLAEVLPSLGRRLPTRHCQRRAAGLAPRELAAAAEVAAAAG